MSVRSVSFWMSLVALAAPATAQTPPVAAATPAVDPARLTAARALIDQIFPPASREEMIQAMMAPMVDNVRQSIAANPKLMEEIGRDPRVKTIFDRFMDRMLARSTDELKAGLPGMIEAMSRAYARRFDLAQLRDLATFFSTPTGRAYVAASKTIMADPDVAVWQRELMTHSLAKTQDEVAAMTKEVAALQAEGTSK